MKEVILKRIKLSNWKSLNLDVKFNDKSTKISAKNGVGKSSLIAGWNWLLSGYTNAVAPKNHELFDNREELTHETPIASVKAWISINDVEYTIEKTAQAKFTRKRGSNEWTKDSSDTYKTYIDEIETSATDFNGWIEHNICPADMLVYCLDGTFFTVLADEDKRKARKVLENIVGEIKEDDFSGNYDCLKNDFAKGYTIEQIEERTKNQIKPLRDRLVKIPALIEDKERLLSEYLQTDYSIIETQIEETRNDIQKIDDQILGNGESIKPILGQRDTIFDLINSKTLKLNERKNVYLNAYNAVRNEIKGKISDVSKRNAGIKVRNEQKQCEYDYRNRNLEQLNRELKNSESFIDDLRKQKDEIKARIFKTESCAYCGQELPMDTQEELKAKFNERKQKDLDFVVAQGKNLSQKIEDVKRRISDLQVIIDKGVQLEEFEKSEILEAELKAYESSYQPFEETKEYAELKKEIDDLNNSLPEIPQNNNEELTNAKKTLLSRLESLNQQLGGKYKAEQIKEEIDSLKSELRKAGNEIAELEGVLFKCKEYSEERADVISCRVNDKLTDCKIVMFEVQKNGDLVPSCTITDNNGVKYSTLNNSNRIKTCISLQQLFCKHFDISMPTFIDESSIFDSSNIPQLPNQTIYLYASDSPVLVIE